MTRELHGQPNCPFQHIAFQQILMEGDKAVARRVRRLRWQRFKAQVRTACAWILAGGLVLTLLQ